MRSTTGTAEAVIRVGSLRKTYGELVAVDNVSFEVQPGEVFGLLGPNGAGKTTTVEVLEGLRKPDSGEVSVLGIDVIGHPDDLRPRIGVSLQTAAPFRSPSRYQRSSWTISSSGRRWPGRFGAVSSLASAG
jgi:ABC-type multidrug transport system ATPase subunit